MPSEESRNEPIVDPEKHEAAALKPAWRTLFRKSKQSTPTLPPAMSDASSVGDGDIKAKPAKWSMGILSDHETDEVPGASDFCSRNIDPN